MDEKRCTDCKETKPREDFHRNVGAKDGLHNYCKPCKGRRQAAWRRENPDIAERQAGHSRRHRLSKYGLTEGQYDNLLEMQMGGCAICGRCGESERLAVDHDHSCCPGQRSCGKCVRGLLCVRCNVALGSFLDDPQILRAAVRYLDLYESCGGFARYLDLD